MVVAGDECGRTQNGNNNAYCQDNEISWIRWQGLADEDRALTEFFRMLLRIRREHPLFRRSKFLTGEEVVDADIKDARWLAPNGHDMTPKDWGHQDARCLGLRLFDAARRASGNDRSDLFLILLNAHDGPVPFTLPIPLLSGRWQTIFDTARPEIDERTDSHQGQQRYPLLPRSFALLQDL